MRRRRHDRTSFPMIKMSAEENMYGARPPYTRMKVCPDGHNVMAPSHPRLRGPEGHPAPPEVLFRELLSAAVDRLSRGRLQVYPEAVYRGVRAYKGKVESVIDNLCSYGNYIIEGNNNSVF